jgi:hypothetical protein
LPARYASLEPGSRKDYPGFLADDGYAVWHIEGNCCIGADSDIVANAQRPRLRVADRNKVKDNCVIAATLSR